MQLGISFVDGDWTEAQPDGAPKVSYPFKGDSVLSTADIVVPAWIYYPATVQDYVVASLGDYPNIQPWTPNQRTIVLAQDFLVNAENYEPAHLNSPYNPAWALEWLGIFPDGYSAQSLSNLILVEEGEVRDAGAGIYRVTRTFAIIPPTRNEMEQFVFRYPGFSADAGNRQSFEQAVNSRLQYDYFIFDDLDIAGQYELYPSGNRLDSTTGLYPPGLIIPAQYYFSPADNAIGQNLFLDANNVVLSDADPTSDTPATIPSYTDWLSFMSYPAEIVAQASTFDRWMGNIWVRRTRFVLAL